ncbi:Protein FAM90A17 [Vulpes lagopus]
MPMPVYTTRRPSIPDPALLMQPRPETPVMRLQCHSTSPLSSTKVSLSPPGGPPGAQEGLIADPPQPARQPCVRADSLVVQQRAKRPCRVSLEGPKAGSKGHGLGHTQAPPKYPENTHPAVSNALADNSQMPLQTPGKKCAQMSLDRSQNPQKKARWSPSQHTPRSIQGVPVGISGSLCPPGSRRARGCTAGPPQTRKTPALQPSKGPQPTPATPHLGTLQPCTDPPRPPSARAPTQPLRMVFTRLDRSCWSSRFLVAPSFLSPEKPGPAQGPPAPHMSHRACVCGPWSVLHGDLQVSSSSEDSESE